LTEKKENRVDKQGRDCIIISVTSSSGGRNKRLPRQSKKKRREQQGRRPGAPAGEYKLQISAKVKRKKH